MRFRGRRKPGSPEIYRCGYCGRSLDLRYYFCVNCATPYREPEARVYGEEPPHTPTLESRLTGEGSPALNFFCLLAIGLVTIGTLSELAGEELLAVTVLLQAVLVASVTLIFSIRHWPHISHLFRGIRVTGALAASAFILIGLLFINKEYHDLVRSFLAIDEADTHIAILERTLSPGLLVLTLCVIPAIFEEIGFRGVVQERLVAAVGSVTGILATSVLFVALHFSIVSAPYLFLLSLLLCCVRASCGSIYPVIALHFAHNLAVVVYF